ncbi:hypothetical protein EOL73_04325 [Candidatus Saccharibacteria bacterium]|nr:hypothetical protein [Candidatus Saccharibacteria bacterium]
MIELTLTDGSTSATLPLLAPPLSEAVIEGSRDVTTLDMNVSTYFTYNKRQWEHTWAYLDKTDFDTIKGFYDRQFTLFAYPLLTCTALGVSAVPVRMTLSARQVINNCERVEDVSVTFRETRQL